MHTSGGVPVGRRLPFFRVQVGVGGVAMSALLTWPIASAEPTRPAVLTPLPPSCGTSPTASRQALGLRAAMAELVLLNRLRAYSHGGERQRMLEQAARVMAVTARSWLAEEASAG